MRSPGPWLAHVARRRARSLAPVVSVHWSVAPARRSVLAGVLLAVAVVATLVHPMAGLVVALAPGAPQVVRRRQVRTAAARSLVATMPEVIDLFRVAAGAGATVAEAVREVAMVGRGPVSDALAGVVRRTTRGERLAAALPVLVDELGEPARPLVAALLSCERDGAALAAPLERASLVARDVRRRDAEVAARRVPVRLVVPLVTCVLPAFALLTVVPLLAGTLRSVAL